MQLFPKSAFVLFGTTGLIIILIANVFICLNYKPDKNTSYPFLIKLDGPFTIGDIINSSDVLYNKGIHIFDTKESDIYIFTAQSVQNEKIFIKIDSSSGQLLKNCRYYMNDKFKNVRLVNDFPIVDNGPTLTDTLLPFQVRKYYSSINLLDNGAIEVYLNIRSSYIDSLNNNNSPVKEPYIQIHHPFYLFEVKDKKIYRRINEKGFHENVQLY